MRREQLSRVFSNIDERQIAEACRFDPDLCESRPERNIRASMKRIISCALAAVLILALGVSAYAIWGVPRSTGTHLMPKTAEYTGLSDLPKIEKDVGFPVTVPERFSNGYVFSALRVDGHAVFGENNEVLMEYYAVHAVYSKDGAPELSLELCPLLEYEGKSDTPAPGEKRTVSGVTVGLSLDHYKVVPEDYEKTEDDFAREAAGHYYVSFGSDEIEERDMAFAEFSLGDVIYVLMDMSASAGSFDTLSQMAREIIEAAGITD